MQEWLDNILMYSTHNEGESLIAERFIIILKAEIYIKKWQLMHESKSYLPYLNKLVDNTIILINILLVKSLLMLIILLWLKTLRYILKLQSLK